MTQQIAEAVLTHGEFVLEVDPRPHQRLVDLRWAAFAAGRLIGCKVRIIVEIPVRERSPLVVVKVVPRTPERWRRAVS